MTEGQLSFSCAILKRGGTRGRSETQFTFLLDTLPGCFKQKQKMVVVNTSSARGPVFFHSTWFRLGQGEEII